MIQILLGERSLTQFILVVHTAKQKNEESLSYVGICSRDFHAGLVVKNPPCNAGDAASVSGWGTTISHTMEALHP